MLVATFLFIAVFSAVFVVTSFLAPLSPRIVAGIANFAAQYNYTSISFAVLLIEQIYGESPTWASSAMVSSVFAGSMFGMFWLGFIGDALGRRHSMAITLGIAAFGASLSAFGAWGTDTKIYSLIAVWRFILGVGVGGIYPLSSASCYESANEIANNSEGSPRSVIAADYHTIPSTEKSVQNDSSHSHHGSISDNTNLSGGVCGEDSMQEEDEDEQAGAAATAEALFWQIPGQIFVYLVALLLLATKWPYSLDWRLLLFSGALPLLFAIPATTSLQSYGLPSMTMTTPETTSDSISTYNNNFPKRSEVSSSFASTMKNLSIVFADDEHRSSLIGACLSWFLFDVYVYGVSAFSPVILDEIFDSDSLVSNCWQNIISNLATVPAALLAIYGLRWMNARDLQLIGFTIAIVSFIIFASSWYSLQAYPNSLFALFCYLKFAMATFVPATTFAMANILFPREVRATVSLQIISLAALRYI
jgi:PHS family inorganic phosphate transporter-like MFS transporter